MITLNAANPAFGMPLPTISAPVYRQLTSPT
jgi:hypothetical protein